MPPPTMIVRNIAIRHGIHLPSSSIVYQLIDHLQAERQSAHPSRNAVSEALRPKLSNPNPPAYLPPLNQTNYTLRKPSAHPPPPPADQRRHALSAKSPATTSSRNTSKRQRPTSAGVSNHTTNPTMCSSRPQNPKM